MKAIVVFLIVLLLSVVLFGQNPKETDHADSIKIKKEVEKKAQSLKLQLEKSNGYVNDVEKKLAIEFTLDTFRIEETNSKMIEIDNSTVGMVDAIYSSENDYDKLLNKYYKILIDKLDAADKEILRSSQKNWLVFRDDELQLNDMLSKEKYSGGGTIQNLIVSGRVLEITKNRVIEMFQYCLRFYN
jgi:uncharacterized protein YecT (DUF1311 family)